jgi:hypothetical protein
MYKSWRGALFGQWAVTNSHNNQKFMQLYTSLGIQCCGRCRREQLTLTVDFPSSESAIGQNMHTWSAKIEKKSKNHHHMNLKDGFQLSKFVLIKASLDQSTKHLAVPQPRARQHETGSCRRSPSQNGNQTIWMKERMKCEQVEWGELSLRIAIWSTIYLA